MSELFRDWSDLAMACWALSLVLVGAVLVYFGRIVLGYGEGNPLLKR